MKKYLNTLATLICLFSISMQSACSESDIAIPNLEREKRMALEVEDAVLDGEVIFLEDQTHQHKFMAIDTTPEDAKQTKGSVIILHGRGFHPDWEDAIQPLRVQLAEKNWRTLSVQMPVLVKTAKFYDYVPLFPLATPRIEAAIQYLKDQGEKNIILFAHSCGAHMAMHWINKKGDSMINAYIGAGMGATDYKQSMKQPFPLAKMKVPVLDIYGEDEYPAVIKMATERKAAIEKAGNVKSKQVVVKGANHYFTDKGDELVTSVAEWLDTL